MMNTIAPDALLMILGAMSAFVLIGSLWSAGVWLWALRRRVTQRRQQQRLGLAESDQRRQRVLRLWHEGGPVETHVPDRYTTSWWDRLQQFHTAAGFRAPLHSVLLGLLGACAVAALTMLLWSHSLIAAAVAVAAVLVGFWAYLGRRIAQQSALFDQQLVDALSLAARSLRAGHPLSGAFQLIAEEVPAPVGQVFADVCEQEALGVSHEDAIGRAATSTHSGDMRLFATSISIQIQSGGNLADMMDRLAEVIRDRMRLNRRVRVLTAQTQLSKNVLLALPLGMFVLLNLIDPQYMSPLYHTSSGQFMLLIACIGLILGAWVMNRLAIIKY